MQCNGHYGDIDILTTCLQLSWYISRDVTRIILGYPSPNKSIGPFNWGIPSTINTVGFNFQQDQALRNEICSKDRTVNYIQALSLIKIYINSHHQHP